MSMSRKLKFNTKQLTGHGGIRLEFISREACEVFIAGSFNDWQPASTPMIAVGNGHWLKERHWRLDVTNTAWSWMASGRTTRRPRNRSQRSLQTFIAQPRLSK